MSVSLQHFSQKIAGQQQVTWMVYPVARVNFHDLLSLWCWELCCEFVGEEGLKWVLGDAEQLPFADSTMDAYTIAFGLRNVTDIPKALREAHRVSSVYSCVDILFYFSDWISSCLCIWRRSLVVNADSWSLLATSVTTLSLHSLEILLLAAMQALSSWLMYASAVRTWHMRHSLSGE